MPRAVKIMQGGFSAGQAKAVGGGVAATFSCAGTTQATATEITESVTYISTCGPGAGAIISLGEVNDDGWIHNAGANAAKIYPPTSAQINALGANASMTLPVNTAMLWKQVSSTQFIAILSA